ncbi:MAG TPA: EAL domain-containing protein [Solirubrobacterales bacterium]|jgi:diguanylate cyclase (GGDEF)-like protein|nr:EAL domain-containing protein [Solirubrobacterales bacterium]
MDDFDGEGLGSPRVRLGWALHGCGEEVADGVLSRLEEYASRGDGITDPSILEAIARTDVEATQVLGRWIATGRGATKEEMSRLGALGMLVDQLSLSHLVQGYLVWRDVAIALMEREAGVVAAGEDLILEIRRMVERSCDASLVRMAGKFDGERRRLQLKLAAEQEKLAHLAQHDSLTGLANRRLLAERLEQVLESNRSGGIGVAVCFVDLDDFKAINDALGHEVGDRVLRKLASRLKAIVRPADTVARVGGDEFVVLCTHLEAGAGEAVALAERILASVRDPYLIDDHEILVSASIGVASGSANDEVEAILSRADTAMYLAKEQGGSRCELYRSEIGAFIGRGARLSQDLRRAIEHEDLTVHYQPIVKLGPAGAIASAEIVGLEALARWVHPEEGTISPTEFIPLAERTGLIRSIDAWALEQACCQAMRWHEQGWPMGIAVNLSLGYVDKAHIERTVRSALRESGLPPNALTLEITESRLISDLGAAMDPLLALTDLGVAVAIDDFGVGYSSLSYLEALPINSIKVDRSFIHGLGPGTRKSDVVRAIVELAHTLELRVVAEGVETDHELAQVLELGCDEVQGNLLFPPQPAERISYQPRQAVKQAG